RLAGQDGAPAPSRQPRTRSAEASSRRAGGVRAMGLAAPASPAGLAVPGLPAAAEELPGLSYLAEDLSANSASCSERSAAKRTSSTSLGVSSAPLSDLSTCERKCSLTVRAVKFRRKKRIPLIAETYDGAEGQTETKPGYRPYGANSLLSSFFAAGAAGAIVGASATAAAASRTPKPRLGVQVPWPEALRFRIVATCRAESPGFAAHTSAAAPATSGVANDVPLAKP